MKSPLPTYAPACSAALLLVAPICKGESVVSIDLTPASVGSLQTATFSTFPTQDPALYFGIDFGDAIRAVDFNTAPDGALTEGGTVRDQYASRGVTMNDIVVSASIYGGNNYGAGFATEPTDTQVYTFTTPVIAVGFVNTSPDGNLVEFFDGPDGLGNLLHAFRDQEGSPPDFNTDRFVGGRLTSGLPIRSIKIHGTAEIDELVFAIGEDLPPLIVTPIELNPEDVGDGLSDIFLRLPTEDPAVYLGEDYGSRVRGVDFNTAPDGPISEGGFLTTEYASLGVTMNSIRISSSIYGGNQYGDGYAAEHDPPQIYSFDEPVEAVGIINTSPDRDYIEFYSGPDATGELLYSFRDQENIPINYDIDRFVGAKIIAGGLGIRSFRIANATGNLELDELIFAIQTEERRAYAEAAQAAGLTGPDSLPEADPFCDGVPNLVKFGSNIPLDTANPGPLTPGGTSGLPKGVRIDPTPPATGPSIWRYCYLRRKEGLVYQPEISTDLGTYEPILSAPSVTPIDDDWELATHDIEVTGPLRERGFTRLVISLP